MTKWIKIIVVNLILLLALLEVASRIGVREIDGQDYFLGKKWRYVLPFNYEKIDKETNVEASKSFRSYDEILGWSYTPNQKEGFYFSNDKGFRCSEKQFVEKEKTQDHYPIACVGSSFTFCDLVPYEDSWPSILSEKLAKRTLNMGVQAYGLDQAVLRLINSDLNFDTVLLGIGPNDFDFAVTSVYDYFHGGTKTKPMINYTDDGIYELINVPCVLPEEFIQRPVSPRASKVYAHIRGYNDYVQLESAFWTKSMFLRLVYSTLEYRKHKFNQVYVTPSDELDYCIDVLKLFKDYCAENDIYGLVVFLDTKETSKLKANQAECTWSIVQEKLDSIGIRYLNFQSEFAAESKFKMDEMFNKAQKGHYSPYANQFLANLIAENI